jgi:hypothetical protein
MDHAGSAGGDPDYAVRGGFVRADRWDRAGASGRKTWIGRVLDPRDGAIYQARMALDALRHLVLHGYVGLPIFGRTQTWTPYAGRTTADCRLAVVAASVGGAG